MRELKVGEKITFTYTVTLEAAIGYCKKCFFYNNGYCNRSSELECLGKYRSDGKSVIFKEVKE